MNFDNIKSRVDEFSFEDALAFCGDDEEFLEEVMEAFLEEDFANSLNAYLEAGDWKNYEIKVHALKGNSRMLGFAVTGDRCEALQFAARDNDIAFIKEHHGEMMDTLEEIIAAISDEL